MYEKNNEKNVTRSIDALHAFQHSGDGENTIKDNRKKGLSDIYPEESE